MPMKTPQSFKELITEWGRLADFADDIEVSYYAAEKMRQRGAIPTKYWPILLKKARSKQLRLSLTRMLEMDLARQGYEPDGITWLKE